VAVFSGEAMNMTLYHTIENIRIEHGTLSLIVDGQAISKSIADISSALARASDQQLAQFEVSPSGYGIQWPLLDEDISVDGLLGVRHTSSQWKKSA
jgi:hypothetical protein